MKELWWRGPDEKRRKLIWTTSFFNSFVSRWLFSGCFKQLACVPNLQNQRGNQWKETVANFVEKKYWEVHSLRFKRKKYSQYSQIAFDLSHTSPNLEGLIGLMTSLWIRWPCQLVIDLWAVLRLVWFKYEIHWKWNHSTRCEEAMGSCGWRLQKNRRSKICL